MSWPEPILHVDMDSFFVEVERLRDQSLVNIPVAVGGAGPRGVVASASYEARAFGVRSAQPTSVARRMCPELTVVPPDHARYSDVSTEVFGLFRSFTPLVEGLSLDEAFLDVSGLKLHYESSSAVGQAIRTGIAEQLGLPASVGVASVKFIAKLASEDAKPDGLLHVPVDDQLEYLHALEVGRMWGVGPATMAALERFGVESVADLAKLDRSQLEKAVGMSAGGHLHDLARAIDPRSVVGDSSARSISVEQTYERDLNSGDEIETALLSHAQKLSGRLRRAGLRARTLSLKVRFDDFRTISRSHTPEAAVDGSREIYQIALDLNRSANIDQPVRLLGLGGTSLEDASQPLQPTLGSSGKWGSMEDAVGEIRSRFGSESVGPARLISREKGTGEDKNHE